MSNRERDNARELPHLATRPADAHKGLFGTALLIGGSRGMSGAISLAGMAALRGGAGLVRLATPADCVSAVAAHDPAYMTLPLSADRQGRISLAARPVIEAAAQRATVVGLGPGLSRSLGLDVLVSDLHARLNRPLVIDADGLNALAARRERLIHPDAPRILTPHPGEFNRLAGRKVDADARRQVALELAERWGVVLVVKGHRTIITDGREAWLNSTGNPGMATGGTGDVLTGLITAFACQGLSALDAARLGVYVHGLAGDLAAQSLGQVALTAGDVVRFLSAAIEACHSDGCR